jgi:hypothetical protein
VGVGSEVSWRCEERETHYKVQKYTQYTERLTFEPRATKLTLSSARMQFASSIINDSNIYPKFSLIDHRNLKIHYFCIKI